MMRSFGAPGGRAATFGHPDVEGHQTRSTERGVSPGLTALRASSFRRDSLLANAPTHQVATNLRTSREVD